MFHARHIGITINRPPSDVYAFASEGEHLPDWAAGLANAKVKRDGNACVCESPMGSVRVTFAPHNALGVMDHDVTLGSGQVVHNPFRVLANDKGSEVVFTLYRQPGTSDADFARDAKLVETDLAKLKALLER